MTEPKVRRPFGELPYKDLPGVSETYADAVIDLFDELRRMLRMLKAQGLVRVSDGVAQRPN